MSVRHPLCDFLKFRCAFQVNPPYYVKLVELVPHPETAATVMDDTHALMTKVKVPDYIILVLYLLGMQKTSESEWWEAKN